MLGLSKPVNGPAIDRERLDCAELNRDLQCAGGQILRTEECARRHETVRDEYVRDALQQHIDAVRTELAVRKRCDDRIQLSSRYPARRLERLAVGRLQDNPPDRKSRTCLDDRIDRCIHRDVEHRLLRRRDRDGRRWLLQLTLARLLVLLLDDQLRRILHRAAGRRRSLRVRRQMKCREGHEQ